MFKLRDENASLQQTLRNLETADKQTTKSKLSDGDDELMKVLDGIEIKVPANISSTKQEEISTLLNIAFANKDILIAGITSRPNMDDGSKFYYYNILPKLQAHGLADNEHVPSTQHRRSFLNKAGQALFAAHEKKIVLARQPNEKTKTIGDPSAPQAPAKKGAASSAKTARSQE